jgi:hypothetical protein
MATRSFAATTSSTTTEALEISRRRPTPAATTTHLLFPPLSTAGAEQNGLPWVPRVVISRESLPPRGPKESGGRRHFTVYLQETVAAGKPLSVSCKRRIKARVRVVSSSL